MVGAVPGIVRRAEIAVDAGAAVGELHGLGLAEQDHSGAGETRHRRRVVVGDVVGEQPRAGGGRQAAHVEEILGGVGDAVQRSQILARLERRLCRPGRGERAVGADDLEGAEARIQRLDAGEQRLGQGDRGELAAAQSAAELGNGLVTGFEVGHRRPS